MSSGGFCESIAFFCRNEFHRGIDFEIRDGKGFSITDRLSPGNVSHLTDEQWEERDIVRPDFSTVQYSAVDFSSDGRLLAIADDFERIHFVDSKNLEVHCTVEAEGGEWISCVRFSPNNRLLAAACSFQGGGFVAVYRLDDRLNLEPGHTWMRCNLATPNRERVDTLCRLAFVTGGNRLALFDTSECERGSKPAGWIGNVVLFDTDSPIAVCCRSIDAELTGDRRDLDESHAGRVFATHVAVVGDHIYCGARGGVVIELDRDADFVRRIELDTKEDVVALAQNSERLWAATRSGMFQIRL